MTLHVQPAHLEAYSNHVRRAGDDCAAVRRYLGQFPAPSGWDGALIRAVGPSHADSLAAALRAVGAAGAVLGASAAGLTDAARHYALLDGPAPPAQTCPRGPAA